MHRYDQRIWFQKLLYNIKVRLIIYFYKSRVSTKKHGIGDIGTFFRNRKRLFDNAGYFLPSAIATVIITLFFLYSPPAVSSNIEVPVPEPRTGVVVSYNDTDFGWIESKQAFYQLKDRFGPEDRWIFTDAGMKEGLSYVETAVRKPEKEVESTVEALKLFAAEHKPGYCIKAEGRILAVLADETSCEAVIDQIIDELVPKKTNETEQIFDLTISVRENPVIDPGIFNRDDILSRQEAVRYLQKGTLEEKTYTVVPNDTIWSIAREHGLSMDEIIRANPEIRPDYIYPGDTLSLIVPKPFLTVTAEYTREYNRRIQYRTIVKADPALYRTEAITERAGSFGEEQITARIKMVNGLLDNREIVKTEELRPPTAAVVRMGTARTPDDILVASAILPPGVGVITSHFGPRWGRFHYGIDVSSPLGTPVHAYKSGTVAYTGYDPVLGNLVIISHGNDLVTRYGHMTSFLVKTGQKVEAGEPLSLSGNSGYSTGPHVHFEIRMKGVAKDPLQYLWNQEQQGN
jgi:murein DD-endopeptidase MepM/ murein hydrolase activator NlpD